MALKGVTVREQGLLEAAGLWDDFCHFRSKLKAGGTGVMEASAGALLAFMPDGEPKEPSSLRLEEIGREALCVSFPPAQNKEPDHVHVDLEVAPPALAGKTAPEPEVVRWVVRNIDNPAASPSDCPDPFAWTLLRMCREEFSFAAMFVKDIWTKLLVQQAKLGDDDSGRPMDGTPTLEMIERIRAMRDRSNSGVTEVGFGAAPSGAANAGSNPATASGFEEFEGGA